MTIKELKQIDDSIQRHGDDWWNDEDEDDVLNADETTNRGWVIEELLEILEKDNLDLKIIPKK